MVVVESILSTMRVCYQPFYLDPGVERMQKHYKMEHTSKLNALDIDRCIGFIRFRFPGEINQVLRRVDELRLNATKLRAEESRFFMRYHASVDA